LNVFPLDLKTRMVHLMNRNHVALKWSITLMTWA
jgi:hypothetical protein